MYATTHNFPAKPQPTQVGLAALRPHRPWDQAGRSNPATTLAERHVR
jgi:hypothetical protein